MPFMMMWMPHHYWNAIFAWQLNVFDLMNWTKVKPAERKTILAHEQISPIVAPANAVVVDVSEMAPAAKERPTEHPPSKLAKPLPPRTPMSSKKSKQGLRKGGAKLGRLRRRRASGAGA